MKRKRPDRPKGPAARLVALGLLAGVLAGAGAARDIEKSLDKGRIASPAAAAAVPAASPPPLSAGALELASTHGYALAAELGFAGADDCRTIEPELRPGCLDYVADRAAGAQEAHLLPL